MHTTGHYDRKHVKRGINMSNVTIRGNTALKVVFPFKKPVTRDGDFVSATAEEVRNAYEFTYDRELRKTWQCW